MVKKFDLGGQLDVPWQYHAIAGLPSARTDLDVIMQCCWHNDSHDCRSFTVPSM
jgi:hypothetical protein